MAVSPLQMLWEIIRAIPREAVGLTGFALAFAAVVIGGLALSTGAAPSTPLVMTASYAVPGAVAFGLWLLLMRRD